MGQMTLAIVWLPLPAPAPSSAKETWSDTMTGCLEGSVPQGYLF